MKKITDGLQGAIGSRYLKNHNQLVFTEYAGFISKVDLVRPLLATVSQGTATIKGTWSFDCESGTITAPGAVLDIWWHQIDAIRREMAPQGNARIVNLGIVDFNMVTPASLQSFEYGVTPIVGNNDSTNKLVAGDVFCVQTREGNFSKLKVITYGYDIVVQWVTYKLAPAYTRLGIGYNQPEDIAVMSDEATAYVTERSGNLVRINLASANRASATLVCSGMTAPHQIWLDQAHNQAYVVEYANPGKLYRINLASGAKTILYSGLNLAVGLVLTSDLAYAYVSEQGLSCISRIDLATGTKIKIASGLTNPFFLSWNDSSETMLLVPERDPVNRISLVDITKTTGNVTPMITGVAFRPSSIAVIQPGTYCVCSDTTIDEYFLTASTGNFLYKGIGFVPWNLITALGMADTTTQAGYPFQFPKNSPFGGTLPVNIDHRRAWDSTIRYYKVKIDGTPRFESWNDLIMNPINGRYEILELQKPDASGFYSIHDPVKVYYNSDLGCLLSTIGLSNDAHSLSVEFYDIAHVLKSSMGNTLLINNESCSALLDMPLLDLNHADPNCGYLKYTDPTHNVTLHWMVSHPKGFATWSFSIVKGANGFDYMSGALVPPASSFAFDYNKTVANFLGTCPKVAAFAESLYVATTVINGVGRQSQYDASATIAFCLAP